MESNKIRIVAAVVDTTQLTLYKENGEVLTIPQGDPRLRRIIEEATPSLVANGYADIVVDPVGDNTYAEFEKQSGIVKLFRIAKSKLTKLFVKDAPVDPISIVPAETSGPVSVTTMADVPAKLISDAADAIEEFGEDGLERYRDKQAAKVPTVVSKTMSVIDEIMQHAVPVASSDFNEQQVAKQANIVEDSGETPGLHTDDSHADTIIAVVDGQIIPGMEKIKTQFARAAKLGSPGGVEKFLQRLAKVINRRSHSIEDLLKFMERGDLPIADDGSILIYKVLNRAGKDRYVDCHTRKVEQWIGAYVCMDEKLVDHNRSTECSNGLHVARRGYIHGFPGDVCVLAKLAPEDVIAVPTYDANKMRVCGYHIIMELSSDQFQQLKANKPLTNTEAGKALLAKAMAGHHIRRTHEVRITEHKGGGVMSKELEKEYIPEPVVEDIPAEPAESVAPVVLSSATVSTGHVGLPVSEIEAKVRSIVVEQLGSGEDSVTLDANLYDDLCMDSFDAVELVMAFEDEFDIIISDEDSEKAKTVGDIVTYITSKLLPAPTPAVVVPVAPRREEALENPNAELLEPPINPLDVVKKVEAVVGRKAQAKALYDACVTGGQPALDALHAFKKASKTSWEKLGLPDLVGGTFTVQKPAEPQKKPMVMSGKSYARKTKKLNKVKKEVRDYVEKLKVITPVATEPVAISDTFFEDSPRKRIEKLMAIGLGSPDVAKAILTIKQKSKKRWDLLGVDDATVAQIMKLCGK